MTSLSSLGGASAVTPALVAGAQPSRPAGLDMDLAEAQRQLADWVACPSGKTPEGKQKIAEISAKLVEIKSKMKAEADSKPVQATSQPRPAGSAQGAYVDTYA
ncbi:MAG TPA: hypothetical protein VGM81_09335 [Burkholderiaceae bacterium]|jgi:hypothetical protein